MDVKHTLLVLAFTVPRPLVMMNLMPFFGQNVMQGLVRNSAIIALALVLYPSIANQLPEQVSLQSMLVLIFKEVVVGVILGYSAALIFRAAEAVGYFIDNQRGTTMASMMDPTSGEQTSPLGSLFMQLLIVMFFTSGGFLILLRVLFDSYTMWPVSTPLPILSASFATHFINLTTSFLKLVVVLAAPVVLAVFTTEFGMGLINRFAPQLNVFFLSMPVKSAVAFGLLILYLQTMMTVLGDSLADPGVLSGGLLGAFDE